MELNITYDFLLKLFAGRYSQFCFHLTFRIDFKSVILNLFFSTKRLVFSNDVETRFFRKLLAICHMSSKDSGRIALNSISVAAKE